MNRNEIAYLLSVDVGNLPAAMRAAITFDRAELTDLLDRAGAVAAPLAIVRGSHSLVLISTHEGRLQAFPPVLECLRERARRVAGLGSLRVLTFRGKDVARRVARLASGLEADDPSDFVSALEAAVELAERADTLSSELTDLLDLVRRVSGRVRAETRLSHHDATLAESELELLAVERIVEEEILEWQFSAPELRSESMPVPALGEYEPEEAQSAVRIRVARALDKLGSAQ